MKKPLLFFIVVLFITVSSYGLDAVICRQFFSKSLELPYTRIANGEFDDLQSSNEITELFYIPENPEKFWKIYDEILITMGKEEEEGKQKLQILIDELDKEKTLLFLEYSEKYSENNYFPEPGHWYLDYKTITINEQQFTIKQHDTLYFHGMWPFEYNGRSYIFFYGHNKSSDDSVTDTIFLFDVTDEENTRLAWCDTLYKYGENDYYGPKVGIYGGKLCFLITDWLGIDEVPEYIQYGWVTRTKLYTLETDGLAEALDSEGRAIELDYDWEKNGEGKIIRKHIPANPRLLDYAQNKTDAWKLIPFQSGKKVGPLEDIIAAKLAAKKALEESETNDVTATETNDDLSEETESEKPNEVPFPKLAFIAIALTLVFAGLIVRKK